MSPDAFLASLVPGADGRLAPLEDLAYNVHTHVNYGDILLRSQLDCHEPSLVGPLSKVFDLKTRATLPIRLDNENYEKYLSYKLTKRTGTYNSFEREIFDMVRSAFLKYSFQCRIGQMRGVLVAFHNTEEVFGFEFFSIERMEAHLYGDPNLGDKLFDFNIRSLQNMMKPFFTQYILPLQKARGWEELPVTMAISARRRDNLNHFMEVYLHLTPNEADDPQKELPWAERYHSFFRLDGMSLTALQDRAQECGLTITDKMDRLDLIDMLESHLTKRPAPSRAFWEIEATQKRLIHFNVYPEYRVNGEHSVDPVHIVTPDSTLDAIYNISVDARGSQFVASNFEHFRQQWAVYKKDRANLPSFMRELNGEQRGPAVSNFDLGESTPGSLSRPPPTQTDKLDLDSLVARALGALKKSASPAMKQGRK
jgi:hypothetical protein